MSNPEERLKRLVIDVLLIDDAEFRDENGPAEIESWDSLATVALAAAVEKEFGLKVPPEEMIGFDTIGDVRRYCRAHGVDV